MSIGAAILALGAVQAVSQVGQGYVQKAENEYNATLLEGKAKMIGVQKDISNEQFQRFAGQTLSASMASVGASGIKPTGSILAGMLDTQKQIGLDQIYTKLNYESEQRYTRHEADAQRRAGKAAVRSGWTSAFTTMLKSGISYAAYKGMPKDMGGGGTSQYGNVYGLNTPKGSLDMGSYSKFAGRL